MSKKENNKLATTIIRIIVTTVTLLCIMIGAAVMVQNCCKIAYVGADLIRLNDNAQFYNEQVRKTNAMTDNFIAEKKERNQYYQSEDAVTRMFSNLPSLLKFVVWVLAILCVPGIPLAILLYIVKEVFTISYFRKRKKRMQKQQQKIKRAVERKKAQSTAKRGELEIGPAQ